MLFRTHIGAGGRLVLPLECRRALGIKLGDEVLIALHDNAARILTPKQALVEARGLVRRYVPAGRSLVDELLAERRTEAAGE